MRLANRFNLTVLGLLLLSMAAVGVFLASAFSDLREEGERWLEASAGATARSIGSEAREAIDSRNLPGVDRALAKAIEIDRNLLWVSAAFGADLSEVRSSGDPDAGPHRSFEVEVGPPGPNRARVRLHYATGLLADRLDAVRSRVLLGAAATLLALCAAAFVLVRRLLSRPLGRLVESAERLAAGDLTGSTEVGTSDELGLLAASLNRMAAGLREMLGKLRLAFGDLEAATGELAGISRRIASGASDQTGAVATVSSSIEQMNASIKSVVQSMESLDDLAGESSSSMLQMSASIDQVAGSAEKLSAGVDRTSHAVGQMSASARSISESVGRLADLVATTTAAITRVEGAISEIDGSAREGLELSREVARSMTENGLEHLGRTASGMEGIRASVDQASAVIRSLEDRSREIGSILGVINEVNDQTNLLALNAAILAAQAGEQGRGFAVVAEEIRELSARTASSTKEITRLITSVQKEATNAVTVMGEGTARVEAGVRSVAELGEALRSAAENSGRSAESSRLIAKASAEQYQGIRQIATSAQSIAEMSREIAHATKEQSAGSAQIVRVAEEMRELARQVKRAMSEQARGVKLTSRASEESARLAQQVLEASREEARGSELVVQNIGAIQEVSDHSAGTVRQLDGLVEALGRQAALLRAELAGFKIDAGP